MKHRHNAGKEYLSWQKELESDLEQVCLAQLCVAHCANGLNRLDNPAGFFKETMDILEPIKYINEQRIQCAIMFSCGRDSIIMTDLFFKHARQSIKKIVFLYYCPNMSYEEKILTYYENRYQIPIERLPHPDCVNMLNTVGKKKPIVKMAETERQIKALFDVEFTAWGYRKNESLQRRGQLALTDKGIDFKYRKCFPIMDWTDPLVRKYVSQNKLLIPIEYTVGFRDLNSFKGASLLYIYNNYQGDYKKIIQMFPDIQGELIRAMEGHGGKAK